MLSAVLRKKTGMSLTEFLTPRLYEPLDILSHHWETCPKGMEKGGWGLNLCIEDLAKIAQLYLNRGVWNGRRLLSEEWIDAATSPQIPTPNGEMRHGYGYQIWMSGGGAYQFNGAFGQYAVIFPQYDAVAVIYSGSTQLFAKTSLMQLLDSCFWACSDRELAPYPPGYDSLKAYLAKLVFSPEPERKGLGTDKIAFNKIRSLLDGREFRLFDNYGSLFPAAAAKRSRLLQQGCGHNTLQLNGKGPGGHILRAVRTQYGIHRYGRRFYGFRLYNEGGAASGLHPGNMVRR